MKEDLYIFIYGTEPLPCGLDKIEDGIFERIEGYGDVSGSGTGNSGWNVDLSYESPNATNRILIEAVAVLKQYDITEGVSFDVGGKRYCLDQLDEMLQK
ncbi:hypothetical protein [Cerasicoccus maritimus]|uniref:hypothetical protein n=1 Tax=Cerasicoccus maritimus TaxID=490089 RepID=UPI002852C1C4|nr:hypothetical protein [Cerasicoccus maritimus]